MNGMQWMLEVILLLLLSATLFYALRLERALGVLKRDRTTLEELVAGFNGATHQAQQGVDRLQEAADGAGKQMARQIETVTALKEDLLFLTERGERLADRLDQLVRQGRATAEPLGGGERRPMVPEAATDRKRSPVTAEPARTSAMNADLPRQMPELARALSLDEPRGATADSPETEDASPRVRSQAERDLLRALRMAR
jgi:hypothetical protein